MSGRARLIFAALLTLLLRSVSVRGETPAPTLETVFPPGGTAGNAVAVEFSGAGLAGVHRLYASIPGFTSDIKDASHAVLTIPAETLPGIYDVWAVSDHGVSAPRSFAVSHRPEQIEPSANDARESAFVVPLNGVVNGRIEQPGDEDYYRFEARRGQRIIIDCWAERIDSRLRGVLEVFDEQGRRLAVNRGYHGIDPLIVFSVPADGSYVVKVHDLIYTGGADHYYRLEIDCGPRIAFTVPNVVPRGQTTRMRIFGWNLHAASGSASGVHPGGTDPSEFDRLDVEISAAQANSVWPLPFRLTSRQLGTDGFPVLLPGGNTTALVGLTDAPVTLDGDSNHAPALAQAVSAPCEVSGRITTGDELDWFALDAQRGEVFYLEVLSQRLGLPTDLHLSVWNTTGEELLAEWNDEAKNLGGPSFPTDHLDPVGRWVAPASGRYLILVRSLRTGTPSDSQRSYRLSVRREEPDMQLVAISAGAAPLGFSLRRGGRLAVDVLALRRRGCQQEIRVSAKNLPAGVECPPITLGPGVDRGTMVISAQDSAENQFFSLVLEADAKEVGARPVRGSAVVRGGTPNGWSRLTSEIPVVVADESPVRVTAAVMDQLHHHLYGPLKLRYSPGSVLDVAVSLEQRQSNHRPAVKLTGVGLPPLIAQQTAVIPAGSRSGTISFWLPPTVPIGEYSLAVAAETAVPAPDGKSAPVTVVSNPMTFRVEPSGFEVAVDPFTPRRVKRGETFQVSYAAVRTNGFIGKIHTELAATGVVTNVPGLRGRGVTFVGQTEQGSIQVVVNDDAPVGPVPFLRLFGVGVVEDQPTYFGAALLPLEITE
jgi:hypothetical protein